jgi:rhodanese-related sulfurtransferase
MQHLTPKEAWEYIQANPDAVFIDVRSEMEYMFVGHPCGSVHIPWLDGPEWELNTMFVPHVRKAAGEDRPIVLICRSGHRSVDAALALKNAGLKNIYNVRYGFEGDLDDNHHRNTRNGWRVDGLPWVQS